MLWLFFLPLLHAQTRLVPIEVRSPQRPLVQESSAPVYETGEDSLQSSSQIQDSLQRAPGVMFTQNGGVGGRGTIYLRGSESRHTLLLTDGIRLNDPSNTDRGIDTAFLMTPFFQNLLLLQGPAPALYGGDATSGVIELVPRRGHTPQEKVLGLSGGSFDTFQGFGLFDWKGHDHMGTAGIAHLRTRGFSRLNRKRYGAHEPDGATITQGFQASRHQWKENLQSDFLLYGFTGQAEQDGMSGDTKDRTNNQQGTLAQTTRGQFDGGDWWLKTGVVSQKRELHSVASADEMYRGQTRSAQLGLRREWGKAELLGGIGGDQEWLAVPKVSAQNDLGSVFALGRYRPGKWLVELGGRGERHQRYGNFFAHEGTIAHQTTEALRLYLKEARGYKSPSLYQLYAPASSYGPVGNSSLTPEQNQSLEAGLIWRSAGEISLVAFQQDFKNLLSYTTVGYQNRGALRVRGAEASVLSPEHFWGQVQLTASALDFSHYQTAPLRRPPYLVGTTWLGTWGRWGGEFGVRMVGGRKDLNSSNGISRLTAYELLSGALKFNPDDRQQWTLRVGNLTDRHYEDVWGYNVAPVNFALQWLGRY